VKARSVSRHTETRAIGRVGDPPRLSLPQLYLDRAACVTRRDWHGHYLLAGRINRALHAKAGE
jgi:hypothetical protein